MKNFKSFSRVTMYLVLAALFVLGGLVASTRYMALKTAGDAAAALERGNSYLPRNEGYADYLPPGSIVDKAIAGYDTAIRLKPDFAEAYLARGDAYTAKQDYARAVADYDKAIQLDPDLPGAYRKRGRAYKAVGDDTRALADYDKDIQLNPNDGDAYYNRANFYYGKRDYDKVIVDLGKAIQLMPTYPEAYYFRAGVLKDQGKKDQAIADLRKVMELPSRSGYPDLQRGAQVALKELGAQ